ncbi:MAG: hypothetical protein D8M58_21675 [Calditrichaeota bacterium]|nr:MAG: hypothetical protein DWQ03_17140 [Calditrichota bacterium]MBL1208025.1 hypothetical protein [Calditrichota bacterium]NOG47861.1 hypothetical protein [Calditrichota bacterium]
MNQKYWLKILPILFLVATFEHCYSILNLYNGGLIFPVITTILLVLAIDTSIYFSMQYFELLPARIILIMSGTTSVALNVKYMLDWKPDGNFGLIIAITVGILIPLMLSMFGWLEKSIHENMSITPANGKLENLVKFHVEKYPDLSNREIANVIGCSHTTIRKYRTETYGSTNK